MVKTNNDLINRDQFYRASMANVLWLFPPIASVIHFQHVTPLDRQIINRYRLNFYIFYTHTLNFFFFMFIQTKTFQHMINFQTFQCYFVRIQMVREAKRQSRSEQ